MEDKDFLGYFSKLGPPSSVEEVKSAAGKIVNTLVAISGVKGADNKASESATAAMKAKYLTGDLGEKMSADLNYTLKRLVRGLYSENHSVKQGFFISSVLVLNRFKSQIDFEKYLKHVFSETKVNQGMKSSEAHNMSLGRMMCLSACIEARVFISSAAQQVNQRTLKAMVGCLVELFNSSEFLQESIVAVLAKLLTSLKDHRQVGLSALEIIVETLITGRSEGSVDFKSNILSSSNKLSLYLRLKEVYHAYYSGQSKEFEEVFAYKVLSSDKQNLKLIQGLISRQTYLYPRLHSCIGLLMSEISREEKVTDRARLAQQFLTTILTDHLFNEETYQGMKSTAKFKFLYIGLSMWKLAAT